MRRQNPVCLYKVSKALFGQIYSANRALSICEGSRVDRISL